MSGVGMLHFLKDWQKFIHILLYYTMAIRCYFIVYINRYWITHTFFAQFHIHKNICYPPPQKKRCLYSIAYLQWMVVIMFLVSKFHEYSCFCCSHHTGQPVYWRWGPGWCQSVRGLAAAPHQQPNRSHCGRLLQGYVQLTC